MINQCTITTGISFFHLQDQQHYIFKVISSNLLCPFKMNPSMTMDPPGYPKIISVLISLSWLYCRVCYLRSHIYRFGELDMGIVCCVSRRATCIYSLMIGKYITVHLTLWKVQRNAFLKPGNKEVYTKGTGNRCSLDAIY